MDMLNSGIEKSFMYIEIKREKNNCSCTRVFLTKEIVIYDAVEFIT